MEDFNCKQTHVHEYQATTRIHEDYDHRVAGISGMVLPMGTSHVHELMGHTTFMDDHFHHYYLVSGPVVEVDEDAHVHYVEGVTSVADGHVHEVELTTFQFEAEKEP